MNHIGPAVPLLVIEAGEIHEEALKLMDDIRVIELHHIQGDQGADGKADGRASRPADHDAGNAAEEGREDGLDGIEELFLIELTVEVEGEVVGHDAEDQAGSDSDTQADGATGETSHGSTNGGAE